MQPLSVARRGLLVAAQLVALLLAAAVPLAAQEASPAPGAATPEAAEADVLAPLLEVLRDDAARAALVAALEEAAAPAEGEAGAAAEEAAPAEQPVSLSRQLAVLTQSVAEGTMARATEIWAQLRDADRVFRDFRGTEIQVLIDAVGELLLAIVITVAVFFALRIAATPLYRAMGRRATAAGVVGTATLYAVSLALDVLIVTAAWAIGYAASLLAVGEFGTIGIRQTLYLNAFLLVELAKVAVRALLSPATAGLRLLPLSDVAARRLNGYANVVVTVLGYGQLLIVPIINRGAGFAAGRSVSALLAILVLLYVVYVVLRHRRAVVDWLLTQILPPPPEDGEGPPPARRSGLVVGLARNWHVFMLVYLTWLFVVVMTRSGEAVFEVLAASGRVALVLIVALLASGALGRAMARGVTLPEEVRMRLPLLEPRLNRFVPRALFVLRYALLLGVVAFALDEIGAFDVDAWLDSETGLWLTGAIVSVFLIVLVSFLIWLALNSWVDYRLNPDYGRVPTPRETTLLTLFRNAATIVLLVLTLMFCLSEIGLNIGPLLASAGVLGLAIGFGAQRMVQDIITGIFIQFENAINVGDVVTVGGVTGGVEKLTVRSVSLRDLEGVFHIIPFSSVDMVSNYTREFSYFVADMGIAYREDVGEAKRAMLDGFDELRRDNAHAADIIGELEWFGLNAFGDSAMVVRARIKTRPGKQWGIGRAYNEILKRIFDERGIEIPFPHQTIYFGEAKDGSTQPIRLAGGAGEGAPHA